MGGTMTWASMSAQPTLSPNELFPAICKMADGTMLRVVPRMSHHLAGDGELYTLKGTDNGNGTITWGTSWQKIYSRKGAQWDVRGGQPSLVPSGPYAGRVVIVMWEAEWLASRLNIDYLSPWPTVRVASYVRVLLSTDANCTAWTELSTLPPGAPWTAPETNDCNESPIQFLPNGDWMICNYTRETHDYIGWYSSSYFRSTDNGATWTMEGFVSRADTGASQATAYMADEPQMLMLDNGELLCAIRVLEAGNPQLCYHHMYRCSNPTARGAMTWVFEGRVPGTVGAGSRCALWQHSNGMIAYGFRTIWQPPNQYGLSSQGAWISSNDNGHTWTAPRNLDSGALSTASTGAVYSYGAWAELSNGGLVHVYCEDNGSSSYTKQALFSVVSTNTAVGRSLPMPSSISATVGRSINQTWVDYYQVGSSCVMPYEVQAVHASLSLPQPFTVKNAVSSVLSIPFKILSIVGDSLEFRYSIPSTTITYATDRLMGPPQVTYNTLRRVAVGTAFPVGRSVGLPYEISPPVAAPLAMPFKINIVTSRSLQMTWLNLILVGRSIDIGYDIAVARSLDQPYSIYRYEGRSLPMRWSDTGTVGRSADLWYNIGTTPEEFQMPIRLPARTKARS